MESRRTWRRYWRFQHGERAPYVGGRGTGYMIDEDAEKSPNSVPIGFVPNTSSRKWGEAVWTSKDLT